MYFKQNFNLSDLSPFQAEEEDPVDPTEPERILAAFKKKDYFRREPHAARQPTRRAAKACDSAACAPHKPRPPAPSCLSLPGVTLDDVGRPSWAVTDAELSRAFRRSSLRVHPDKNPAPDAREAFDALKDAAKILKDPSLRGEALREAGERELQRLHKEDPARGPGFKAGCSGFGAGYSPRAPNPAQARARLLSGRRPPDAKSRPLARQSAIRRIHKAKEVAAAAEFTAEVARQAERQKERCGQSVVALDSLLCAAARSAAGAGAASRLRSARGAAQGEAGGGGEGGCEARKGGRGQRERERRVEGAEGGGAGGRGSQARQRAAALHVIDASSGGARRR